MWLFLFCGPDAGLVSERASTIVRGSVENVRDQFQVLRLDGDAIAADPQILADEAYAMGLFGGRKCIRIDAGPKSFSSAIENLTKDPPPDCTIVICAGDIKGDSPLRRIATRYARGAAVECYADNLKQLELIVDEEMKRARMTISPGARDFLVSHLGADRLITRAEIEKLLLFANGLQSITEAHVEAVIADAAAANIDEAIYISFSGDYRGATEAAQKVLSHLDAGAFMGFIMRHVLMLHRMRIDLDRGASLDSVTERLPRNIFGSKKTQVISQVRHWSADRLLDVANDLQAALAAGRRESKSAERLAIRALWRIARGSKRAA